MTTIEEAAKKFVLANRERNAAKLARSKARRENRCTGGVGLAVEDEDEPVVELDSKHPVRARVPIVKTR